MPNPSQTPLLKSLIFEHADFLVLNKPAGILSQKDKSGEADAADLLKRELKEKNLPNEFLAPVHRLDRNTSGLLIFARNSQAASHLSELLQAGKIKRTYLTIAKGNTGAEGVIDSPLEKNQKTNEVFVSEKGKAAITYFRQLENLGNSSLLAVQIQTGRSHQIRVHFSSKGHALLGDRKYAKKPWSEIFARPALHAARLQFSGSKWNVPKHFFAPIPDDMRELLLKLGSKLNTKEMLHSLGD